MSGKAVLIGRSEVLSCLLRSFMDRENEVYVVVRIGPGLCGGSCGWWMFHPLVAICGFWERESGLDSV
jgi:hypothetical protein